MMKMKSKGDLNGFLDRGSHLRGELHFDDTFRIDGRLTGGVDSEGDLYVGESGHLEGDIKVGRLYVSGTVAGTVTAVDRVEVAVGGRLLAEVETPCLVLEEGAFFQGVSKMVEDKPRTVAPLRRGETG